MLPRDYLIAVVQLLVAVNQEYALSIQVLFADVSAESPAASMCLFIVFSIQHIIAVCTLPYPCIIIVSITVLL